MLLSIGDIFKDSIFLSMLNKLFRRRGEIIFYSISVNFKFFLEKEAVSENS